MKLIKMFIILLLFAVFGYSNVPHTDNHSVNGVEIPGFSYLDNADNGRNIGELEVYSRSYNFGAIIFIVHSKGFANKNKHFIIKRTGSVRKHITLPLKFVLPKLLPAYMDHKRYHMKV